MRMIIEEQDNIIKSVIFEEEKRMDTEESILDKPEQPFKQPSRPSNGFLFGVPFEESALGKNDKKRKRRLKRRPL